MAFVLQTQQSITSHRNDVLKESGGEKKKRRDLESHKTNVIRHDSPQRNDRISTTVIVWVSYKHWRLEIQEKRLKENPRQTWEEGTRKIFKGRKSYGSR